MSICSCISDLGTLSSISTNNNPTNTDLQNKRNNGDIMSAYNQEKELERKLSPDGTRKLQDEINTLTKRNCELESQLRRSLEAGNSKDLHDTMDGLDLGIKILYDYTFGI